MCCLACADNSLVVAAVPILLNGFEMTEKTITQFSLLPSHIGSYFGAAMNRVINSARL